MIYISGPIKGTDDYTERFETAEEELMSRGFDVINPARYNAQLPSSHVTYENYIHTSLALLDMCSKIYMLDGWENSKGARLEYAYAEALGKKIIYQTPPTEKAEEKKYLWRLREHLPNAIYLNMCDCDMTINSRIDDEDYKTRFTESEYRELAKEHHFLEDMFVKEEIE